MTTETRVSVEQVDREAAATLQEWNGDDMPLAARMLGGREDVHPLVQAFARHRLAALASSNRSEGEGDIAMVSEVETQPIDWPFSDEVTPPIWRVSVGEHVADFDYEQAARNFADAINTSAPSAGVRDAGREAIARAIASKTYAFGVTAEEGSDQYDCGEWEEMGRFARLTYLDAADAVLALTARPDGEKAVTLVSRKLDDDCGCPEEVWDTPFGELHMHLSAGKASNACLDNGDEGERHIDLTCATIDEARAAIFGWAGVTIPTPSPTTNAGGEREDALAEAGWAVIDRMSGTYKARNGREIGIQGDDGEKCWIVHSDDIEALRRALPARQALATKGEAE